MDEVLFKDLKNNRSEERITNIPEKNEEITPISKPLPESPQQYLTKRISIAGGFLDIALFTANCEQFKFILELGDYHDYYQVALWLVVTSMMLQILVGITLFLLGFRIFQKAWHSEVLNHVTMGLVALITLVNICIGTFAPKGTMLARCLHYVTQSGRQALLNN